MRTFDEHMENIRLKAAKLRRRRRIITASCAGTLVLALMLTLFLPLSGGLPSVSRYQNSPYYKLISGLNKATYEPPRYRNNYEKLVAALKGMSNIKCEYLFEEAIPDGMNGNMTAPGAAVDGATSEVYQEVTDNQVQGVIEADIFKRSDKYLYHLQYDRLTVYSIDKENSAAVGVYSFRPTEEDGKYPGLHFVEMYLSEDCSTISILGQSYGKDGSCAVLCSLNVEDPANIRLVDTVCFQGEYQSSRMVGGKILLTCSHWIYGGRIDFDAPETFVPCYGAPEDMKPMAAENILCPEMINSTCYTVVAMVDGKTAAILDTAALLSYAPAIYVSDNTIFATHPFTEQREKDGITTGKQMTEITGIGYTGDELTVLGSVQVEGSVKDQYSMDQKGNVLRVATSSQVISYEQGTSGDMTWMRQTGRPQNCNLYCVDLDSWEVAASVIGFAPEGEEVTSARFDGDSAYICTAEIVRMTDPVYFFDLSDLENITWKQTPVIEGFSSSLIQFGDFLLGIGFNDNWGLKLEVYVETADGVEPVTSYERPCSFSNVYKSYFIDRENRMIGLAVAAWHSGEYKYLLLQYDGNQFHVLEEIPISCSMSEARGTMIDGWLYLLHSELEVLPIFDIPVPCEMEETP